MDEEFSILPTPQAYASAEQTAKARKLAQLLMNRPGHGQASGNAISGIADALKQSDGEDEDADMSAYASAGNMAAAAPKMGMPPIPGGPVTHAPMEGQATGNMLPSSVLPQRMQMSREGIVNTLASDWLDPAVKQTALQVYMEQNQPMELKTPGGRLLIGRDGSQLQIPELFQAKQKSGDTETTTGHTFQWDPKSGGLTQNIVPTVMGNGRGPLGTAPPSGDPNSVINPVMRQLGDYSQDQHRIKTFADEEQKAVHSKLKESADIGYQASKSTPLLKQLRQMIEDPRLKQGIGADLFLDWDRLKAVFGSKEGERGAALAQAFDKMVSGQIVSDLKTQLQGTGQIRVKEIELVEKASASRYNTREANRAVINLMIKSNEQMEGLTRATAEYLGKHKHNASMDGLIQHKLDWLAKNPMLTQKEIAEYEQKFDEDAKYPVPSVGRPPKGAGNFRGSQPALATPPPVDVPRTAIEEELKRRGLSK